MYSFLQHRHKQLEKCIVKSLHSLVVALCVRFKLERPAHHALMPLLLPFHGRAAAAAAVCMMHSKHHVARKPKKCKHSSAGLHTLCYFTASLILQRSKKTEWVDYQGCATHGSSGACIMGNLLALLVFCLEACRQQPSDADCLHLIHGSCDWIVDLSCTELLKSSFFCSCLECVARTHGIDIHPRVIWDNPTCQQTLCTMAF